MSFCCHVFVLKLSVVMLCQSFTDMLSVTMLSFVMLNVIMLSFVMLNVIMVSVFVLCQVYTLVVDVVMLCHFLILMLNVM